MTRSTKKDIVVTAAELFAERGFAGVTVQEIGGRVGVSGGAIYRHFPNKDAVLDAVLLETIEGWIDIAAREEPDVEHLVRASVQLVVDRPGQLATYVRERHRVARPTRRELAGHERTLFRYWSDAILAARPDLSRVDVVVRQQAINGVLSSLARRPTGIPLVTEGLVALATAPPMDPPTESARPEPTYRAPTPRREEIIAVAMRLFAERGYHGVAMDDIGEAVGMAGPSLYEHVAGKVDILLDAYDRAGAFVVAGAASALASAASATDALDRLIRSYVEVAFDHVDLLVVTSGEGASLPPSERPRLARRRRDVHEQWAAVVRELRADMSASEARALVRSAQAMVAALARQRRDGSPSVPVATALVRSFLLANKEQT